MARAASSAGETSMKTSPPEVSLSHSWQFSVRISMVMHVAPELTGANSTTRTPFSSADSHDCASGARLPAGTLCSSSYGLIQVPPLRSETPQCSRSGWPSAAPPARHSMRTLGGHVAITDTSHAPVEEPLSVESGMVCDATTAPEAPPDGAGGDGAAGGGGAGAGGGVYE